MYIDKNEKRFNPYATHVVNGVTYEGNILDFPEVCRELGIEEIPDPQPPEDYNDGYYFVTEQDTAPYRVYTRKSDELISEYERQKTLSQIRSIEDTVENDTRKITRIFMLDVFEFLAAQNGITPDQLYLNNKGYRGLKDLENQIIPLREKV